GLGSQPGTSGRALATNAAGDVFLAGVYKGNIDFGSGHSFSSAGFTDIFVAHFTAQNGTTVNAASFGGADPDDVRDLAVDQTIGDVVIGGTHSAPIDLGGGVLANA